MFTTIGIIILIAYSFICGNFSGYVASKKGYDGLGWFFLGLLFNLVALIAVAGLPIVTETLTSDYLYYRNEYETFKEELEIDKKNNKLTDEEIKEKEEKLERIKNKLES
ncbi:MAG: hypothetical protein H8E33_04550 [Candidatus Cloacimonetes bacterium]|nr:hypothetical protein [Candidatus Cloacimonadota bacterium]